MVKGVGGRTDGLEKGEEGSTSVLGDDPSIDMVDEGRPVGVGVARGASFGGSSDVITTMRERCERRTHNLLFQSLLARVRRMSCLPLSTKALYVCPIELSWERPPLAALSSVRSPTMSP